MQSRKIFKTKSNACFVFMGFVVFFWIDCMCLSAELVGWLRQGGGVGVVCWGGVGGGESPD